MKTPWRRFFHKVIKDFSIIITIPIDLKNNSMIPLNSSTTLVVPSWKIKVLSTDNKYVILHETSMGDPFILPFASTSLSILLNPSTTKIKLRWDRGYPYLRTLLDLKKWVVSPFDKTTNLLRKCTWLSRQQTSEKIPNV